MDLHVLAQSLAGTADDPETLLSAAEDAYRTESDHADAVFASLDDIEGRGRYRRIGPRAVLSCGRRSKHTAAEGRGFTRIAERFAPFSPTFFEEGSRSGASRREETRRRKRWWTKV